MVAVRQLWGPASGVIALNSIPTYSLNDADNAIAGIYIAEKDGTIDRIGVYITTVTGNPPAYNVALVTVDSAGSPTTTNYGGSATKTYDFTVTGWHWITLDIPATANAGDLFATRIWPTGTPPDASNAVTAGYGINRNPAWGTPRADYFSTAWLSPGYMPTVAARYSDGQVLGFAGEDIVTPEFESDTTPDEVGCIFTLPLAMTCFGCRIDFFVIGSSGSAVIRLYDTDGSTVLASFTISDEDEILRSTNVTVDVFWDAINLAAGSSYRLAVESTHTTAGVQLIEGTFPDVDSRNWLPEGSRWWRTERTNAGAWSETPTKLPIMGLWISTITIPAGGASAYAFVG